MLEVPFALFATTKNQLVCIQGGETKVIPFPIPPYKFVEDGGEGREPYHVIGENTTRDIGRIEYPSIPTIKKPGRIDSLTPELDYILDLVKDHPDIITDLSNGKDPYPIFLDIETAATEEHFPKPERDPIICIQLKYPGEKEVVIHETSQIGEKEILRQTLDYIKKNPVNGLSPDMVVGFFLNKFDIPYMYERVKRNGLTMEWHSLDRTPEGASMFYPRWLATRKLRSDVMMDFARGLVNLDLYLHVKADNLLKELPRRGLKQSSAFYGFTEVFDIEAEQKMDMRTLMSKDYDTFMKYAISDILATEYLYNIYIHRLIAGANLLRCPMGLIHRMSSGQKSYIALYREAKNNKYLSVKNNNQRYAHLYDRAPKYQGAMVDCFAKGYFDKTIYVDAKCVHGDTLVQTKQGYKKIADIQIGERVLSERGFHKVRNKVQTTRTNRLRITTESGNSIIVSDEHRFPVYTKSQRVGYSGKDEIIVKQASELSKDDILLENYEYPIYENDDVKPKPPRKNIETAELMGLFDAEGYMTQYYTDRVRHDRGGQIQRNVKYSLVSFTLCGDEPEIRDRVIYLMNSVFGYQNNTTQKRKGSNAYVLQYCSHDIYDAFKKEYDERYEKIIDNVYLCQAYLRGLFSGDGHYNKTRKTMTLTQSTKNNGIIEFAHKCLIRCGIVHKLSSVSKAYIGEKEYTKRMIEIQPRYLDRFEKDIGTIQGKVKLPSDWTPKKSPNVIRDDENGQYRISKIRHIERYVNSDDEDYMFDITVNCPDFPYFFGNHILTHNSLYPNIMYDFNISPDKYTMEGIIEYDEVMRQKGIDNRDEFDPVIEVEGSPESCVVLIPDDNYEAYLKFRCNFIEDGYIRGIIDYYNGERDRFKKQAQIYAEKYQHSGTEEDRINADMYDSMQQEAKVLNNTMYGVQGDKYSDIGDLPAAIFVTAIGRWIMTQMVEYFGKGTVLEIDTDGLLLNRDHVHQSIEDINEELRNRINTTFGVPLDIMKFKLEFEGAGSVYLYKSKNYILRVDGKDKLTVKGSAFTGYDKAPVIKRSVTLFADAIMFKTMSFSEAERQSLDIYSLPREEFMFSKTLKKKPEGYKGFEDISTYIQAVDHTGRSSREVLQEMKNRAVDWVNTRYKNEDSRTKFTKMIRRCKSEDQLEMVINSMPAVKGRSNARYFMLDLIMRLIFRGKTVEEEDTIEYYWTLTSEKETLAEDMTEDTPIDYERYIIEIGRVIDRFRYADPEELEMDFSLFLDAQEDQIEPDDEEDEEDE